MTTATDDHACHRVDHLRDEVRDLRATVLVYATEDMRRAAIEAAARGLTATFDLPGNDPDVDVDLALSQACQRLAEAVRDADDPKLHPGTVVKRLRLAIDDPGMVLERYRGRDGEPPAESMSGWQLRAVLHVLTYPTEPVNG